MSTKCKGTTVNGNKCRLYAEDGSKFCRHHAKKSPIRKQKARGSKISRFIESPEKNEIFLKNIYIPGDMIKEIYDKMDLASIKLLSSTCRYFYHFCQSYFEQNPRYLAFKLPNCGIFPGNDKIHGTIYKTAYKNISLFAINEAFYPYIDIKFDLNTLGEDFPKMEPFFHQITNNSELIKILNIDKEKIIECRLEEKEEEIKRYVFDYESSRIASNISTSLEFKPMRITKLKLHIGNTNIKLAQHVDFLKAIKQKLLPIYVNLEISVIDEELIYFSDYPRDNVV